MKIEGVLGCKTDEVNFVITSLDSLTVQICQSNSHRRMYNNSVCCTRFPFGRRLARNPRGVFINTLIFEKGEHRHSYKPKPGMIYRKNQTKMLLKTVEKSISHLASNTASNTFNTVQAIFLLVKLTLTLTLTCGFFCDFVEVMVALTEQLATSQQLHVCLFLTFACILFVSVYLVYRLTFTSSLMLIFTVTFKSPSSRPRPSA